MKKILVMAKSFGGGGSEVALIEFLNSLDLNKFSVTVLLLSKDNEYRYRLNKNIKIKYLNFDNPYYKNMVSMYTLSSKIIKKLKLNKKINIYDHVIQHTSKLTEKYDIALDFYGYGSFTTDYVAKVVKADFKATWIHDEKMSWIYNVENDLKEYDKFFCVSKAVKDRFDQLFTLLKDKTMVFYNVINYQMIISSSKQNVKLPYKQDKINLLTVGRLTEQKGINVAIRAAKILKEKGIPFEWFVIGDGRDKKKLLRLIHKEKLDDCFFLLGRKDNPYPFMENCSIYVQPSRHEGFGLTVLEARLLKQVVIATKLPAFKEQIIDNKNGLLVERNNYYDLAKKIKVFIDNRKLQNQVKSYISDEIIKHYNNLINVLFE